jgi:hypothetical protein
LEAEGSALRKQLLAGTNGEAGAFNGKIKDIVYRNPIGANAYSETCVRVLDFRSSTKMIAHEKDIL